MLQLLLERGILPVGYGSTVSRHPDIDLSYGENGLVYFVGRTSLAIEIFNIEARKRIEQAEIDAAIKMRDARIDTVIGL